MVGCGLSFFFVQSQGKSVFVAESALPHLVIQKGDLKVVHFQVGMLLISHPFSLTSLFLSHLNIIIVTLFEFLGILFWLPKKHAEA